MYYILMGIQCAGIVILVLELIFIVFQNSSRIQRDMLFLLIVLLITFAAYTLEMQCKNISEALIAIKFGYLGKPFITLAMLLLILDYCRIRLKRWATVMLALIQMSFTMIVFTAEEHMLFYSSFDFVNGGIFPYAKLGHGPLYNLYIADLVIYCIAMFAVCFRQLKEPQSKREEKQLKLFTLMVFVPLLFFIIFLVNLFPGYDCTLLGYLISTVGFSVSFFRLNLFDTITLAKEQAVDYIHCGLLVYDRRGRLIYQNKLAEALNIRDQADALSKRDEPYLYNGKIYSVEELEIENEEITYGHMFFVQDMTKYYNYEKRLKEEKQRADSASEAKTNFLSSMSHDIRTPMNAILGMTKIARLYLNDQERVKDCLKKIEISGQHLLDLINEVLDMNKIESGMLELNSVPFDLDEFFEEIFTMAKPLAENRNHDFIMDVKGVEHKKVFGDKSRLSQVLMNLISNAVKYTNEGGKIRLSAFEDTQGETDASYTFQVKDNGIGMSEEYLPFLFDRFSRAEDDKVSKIQGTGLGMAITKQFVTLMGGEIKAESKLGEGSTLTVNLMLRLQTEKDAKDYVRQITPDDVSSVDLSSKRVLLVEDNEINAEIAGEILGLTGINVEFAVNGKEAVEKIAGCQDGYYDLVFMDIQMPVMNGYEATKEIRALGREYTKKIPIIAMTANAFAEDVKAAKEAGMNEHISKPLDEVRLMAVMQRWLSDE